jgi:hypothetical protein
MTILKVLSALGFSLSIASCFKPTPIAKNGSNSSKITSVKMRVPTKIGDKDISGKIDIYNLTIKKTSGSCTFVDIDRTEKIVSGDVKIDASLKQDCDYSILLSFGKASTDGSKIEKLLLSSDAHDNQPALPTLVKKEDIKGKTEITIKACVSVTALGAKELGVNPAECSSVSDESINSTLEPFIPAGSTATSLKLTRMMTATPEGAQVTMSGEVTSTASVTKYCGLAVEAFYGTNLSKLVYVDDDFTEIKAAAKTQLTKTFTLDIPPGNGPLMFTELRVMEQCFDNKPGDNVKVSTLFESCMAAKSCPVVKP